MTEYLKMVPLPSWWQKFELNDLSVSELFEELLSWNLESKLITPNYFTGPYFGDIVATLDLTFFKNPNLLKELLFLTFSPAQNFMIS